MKQILQSPRTGEIEVADVPAPRAAKGCVLVRVAASLVSAGTERASADFATKSLIQKAQARPDLVRDVLNKIRRDGLLSAFSAVRGRLDEPSALGYSCAGTVVELGEGISDLQVGDRVACAGAGFAVHAEFACVPRMLVVRIPSSEVDFESAAFTTLGSVAMHAMRTADVKLGEVVAVIGLGLLGQLAVQILRAAGCKVIGLDLMQERAALAVSMGAIAATSSEAEFRDLCFRHSNGYGADSVLITAETSSSVPVNLASEIARDRAIVVAVGAVGMELERRLYYEKELEFRVSRSYGPGRYDAAFEQKGIDYPIGHVRWTETRNMEAFVQLLADGKLNLKPLITQRYSIENAASAYDLITGKDRQPYLGIVIEYPAEHRVESRRLELVEHRKPSSSAHVRVGMLGAGNFARSVLIPAMRKAKETELVGICASSGVRAQSAAKKFGFAFSTTDEEQIVLDDSINTVVVATRHNLHAGQIIRALESGKHVFCEKPLCLTEAELHAIQRAYSRSNSELMVGFNRRFAPMAQRTRSFLSQADGPFTMHYRVNAGPLPPTHWVNDPEQGGGRVLGEMCHFVDLLSFLCGSAPVCVRARSSYSAGGQDVTATVEFANRSIGTIMYVCSGDRAFSKERVEVFGSSSIAALDDFRRLDLVRHGKKETYRSRLRQDKGHQAEWRAFSECVRIGGPAPIAFDEIVASTLATIRIAESLRSGEEELVVAKEQPLSVPLVS
ncbi:MAG: putative oxidoreductase [Acidobacteriaceae bacterium]|nr:putative oxidoreductase [Acidobacteriaceae bacterium]